MQFFGGALGLPPGPPPPPSTHPCICSCLVLGAFEIVLMSGVQAFAYSCNNSRIFDTTECKREVILLFILSPAASQICVDLMKLI